MSMRKFIASLITALLCMLAQTASTAMPVLIWHDSNAKSTVPRQETCAECYEFESDSICIRSLQTTGIAGNLLWAAHYNAFGRASIVTPAPNNSAANAPTINLALRLPGQYEDAETGLHYQATAQGKSQLIPISRLQPGDKVLALSEWKDAGNQIGQDQRLTYEKVTDVFTSLREQTHIYLTLDNGQTLQATEGHPFLTSEGWRDAVLLKRGGKLLIKGDADAADTADRQTTQEALNKAIYKPNQPVAGINTAQSAIESIVKTSLGTDATQAASSYRTILDIRTERQTVQVFNIEVANAHTFFVGDEGVLVHNGGCRKQISRWFPSRKEAKDASTKRGGDGRPDGPDAFGKDGHFHDKNHNDKSKPNIHYRWGGRR